MAGDEAGKTGKGGGMRSALVLVVFVGAAVCGCATHAQLCEPLALSRCGLIEDAAEASALEKAMTDEDIVRLLAADIRAKLPTRLAIAGLSASPEWAYGGRSGSQCGVVTISGEELEGWEKALEGQREILGVQPVSSLVVGKSCVNLRDLRVASAKMNCELLLVYLRSDSTVDNYNDAAALYWTFVGLWLVPGNVYEQRTVMQAIVVDCRTGAILGTATGDCHQKHISPVMYGEVQQGKLRRDVPKKALADLQEACKPLFKNIVAASPSARR